MSATGEHKGHKYTTREDDELLHVTFFTCDGARSLFQTTRPIVNADPDDALGQAAQRFMELKAAEIAKFGKVPLCQICRLPVRRSSCEKDDCKAAPLIDAVP